MIFNRGYDMRKIIVGISGASGAPIAVELLKQLKKQEGIEVHIVYTKGAELTIAQETQIDIGEVCGLADVVYDNYNIGAAIASGSFKTDGMIVVPCSMKTLAGIVSGYSDNLLLRAADVVLKERRKLVLVPRECPFSNIHLKNMYEVSLAGAVVIPPMLSYYNNPKSVDDCTRHIVGKILDQFDLEGEKYHRWV
jgi:4-hydroxy-3-polyprenylbenzoate decarboxylase